MSELFPALSLTCFYASLWTTTQLTFLYGNFNVYKTWSMHN